MATPDGHTGWPHRMATPDGGHYCIHVTALLFADGAAQVYACLLGAASEGSPRAPEPERRRVAPRDRFAELRHLLHAELRQGPKDPEPVVARLR